MELKEMIIKRKSIRKYDMADLERVELDKITEFIKQISPIISDRGTFDFRIVNHIDFFEKTNGMFRVKAPHYILLFGDDSDDAYKNIGYVGELIVLELTRMGFGSCWLGGAKSNETQDCGNYAISIAFGKPIDGFREKASDAKRKNVKDIAEGYSDSQREILEYVKLAPSAMNFQPWYFKCETGRIHVFRKNAVGLLRIVAQKHIKKVQKIDIGIAISHFNLQSFTYQQFNVSNKGMTYEGTICFIE